MDNFEDLKFEEEARSGRLLKIDRGTGRVVRGSTPLPVEGEETTEAGERRPALWAWPEGR